MIILTVSPLAVMFAVTSTLCLKGDTLLQNDNEEARQRIMAFARHHTVPTAPPAARDLSDSPGAEDTVLGQGSDRAVAAKAAIMTQAQQASLSANTHARHTACWHPTCKEV